MSVYGLPLFALAALVLGGCMRAPVSDEAVTLADSSAGLPVPAVAPSQPGSVDGGSGGTPAPVAPSAFVAGVAHPYFPLVPGSVRVYEGDSDGRHRRDEIVVLEETVVIAGVACVAMTQDVFFDGVLSELTTEWFAQDGVGNVWKFGEISLEALDGVFVPTPDNWIAGVDGAQPWLFFAGAPAVGDVYAGNKGDGQDEVELVSLDAVASVPAGDFANCAEVVEDADDPDDPDDTDIILYAPGVGPVSETGSDGKIVLLPAGS